MAGLIEGVNWSQTVLFPVRMEKYINEDSLMRVVDHFVVAADALPSSSADKSLDTPCAALCFRLRTILLSLGKTQSRPQPHFENPQSAQVMQPSTMRMA